MTTTDAPPAIRPTIKAIHPEEVTFVCSENGVDHLVVLERNYNLGLARKAVHQAVGSVESGSLLLELNVDGEGIDRLMVDPAPGIDQWELLLQARDVIAVAIEGLDRLRRA